MKAIIIGRFQPLHKGHLDLVKQVREKGYEVIIGVGNNGDKRTKKCPFLFEEVRKMWLPHLEKLTAKIYCIPDIPNDEDYAKHVETITGISEKNTVLVSGNEHTIKCFTDYNRNYQIIKPYKHIECNFADITGTKIRNLIRDYKEWEELVPEETSKIIKEINGIEIIKKLC
ncbi:MAG: adenylyltransferase/cytidyltransferase family protein [Candidatus Nanoarchaeia archaeon]